MNKRILILAAVFCLPLTVAAGPGPGEGAYDAPPEHRLDRLSKELQLSDDQKAKLEVIFKEQHEKFQAIHEESHNRIKEVLSPEQLSKWEQMKQQRREKHRKMMEKGPQQKP